MKKLLVVAVVVLAVMAAAIVLRHRLLVFAASFIGAPPLLAAADEGPGVRWHDDYFTVERLDARTFAIGEPRYHQQVFSYLLVGEARAVLFDAGPGLRDVRAVAESLTDRPITFVPSHFHFDHVGNEVTFERVAVVDLPSLRARAPDDRLALAGHEHLGAGEGYAAPTLEVDTWLRPGASLDLGGRTLRVLYTPGHTTDSISLLDPAAGLLFTGDFLYPGPLFAFLPNSGMGDYLEGAETLLAAAPAEVRIYGAHRTAPPGAPRLDLSDARALERALGEIRAGQRPGSGFFPVSYPVNERIELWAEPRWLQDWSRRSLAER